VKIKGLLCSSAKVFGDAVKAGYRLQILGVLIPSKYKLVVLGEGEGVTKGCSAF